MKNLKRIIFILLIILPLRVFADYEHFKLWDMSDGLSNNTVKSITQDHLGFIWLEHSTDCANLTESILLSSDMTPKIVCLSSITMWKS